jgi:hypothetical protein
MPLGLRRPSALGLALALPLAAQGRPEPDAALKAQKEAMAVLSGLDGTWRGTAWTLLPGGEKKTLIQTERVGTMLDGTVRVIEGRGYEADGKLVFNAFGVIGYNPATKAYTLQARAQGRAGEYTVTPNAEGFIWEIPAGPATIRYTVVLKGGTWTEVGDRLVPGQPPQRFHEMTLQRLGGTDWPAAGFVGPR